MIRARVVPIKHGIKTLILALKEAEIKAEAIPVHMHHGQTATNQLKYKSEITTVMMHAVKIK